VLTAVQLRSQVDQLWDKLWSGGLSNPLDAIEQLSYLLFLKRIDDEENTRERQARLRGLPYQSRVPDDMRWGTWTHLQADAALTHLKATVFPRFKDLGTEGSSFAEYMKNAECKINKPSLLIEACKLIDAMQISQQNQDVQGDLYEYLLGRLNTAGRNGQFRTPRHIVRLMVQMIDPKPGERIGDLAAGTAGFLVNAYQYMLEQHTSPSVLTHDEDGWPHNLGTPKYLRIPGFPRFPGDAAPVRTKAAPLWDELVFRRPLVGDVLTDEQRQALQSGTLRGYDNDSGMTMLRIGSMNLMLHGIESPYFFYRDTLSKSFDEQRDYDVILMNPPFKGAVDADDVNPSLPKNVKKSEILFLHLILRALDSGGRCAVIVPDGVLFGSSGAHIETRKKLIEENRLEAVISMPSGVFKPYAGVSTAVLIFTRGAKTSDIWFYDMEHDGFSLDDKREPVAENDIPDILACWRNRANQAFAGERAARLAELRIALEPLKAQRLRFQADINRLTFEHAIAPADDGAALALLDADREKLAVLETEIHPLQREFNQLSRQFCVTKAQVAANKYDVSASRYRPLEQDDVYYDAPQVTLARLLELERVMALEVRALETLLK